MKRRNRFKKRPKRKIQSFADAAWDVRFLELKAFRREHGHCMVPSRYREDPSLGNWVNHQRVMYRSRRLKDDRRKRLEQVGFDWISRGRNIEYRDSEYWDKLWDKMLVKLERFHERYGHPWVKASYGGKPSLSGWVKRQRRLMAEDLLPPERLARLKALGLDKKMSSPLNPRWERCYLKLMEFRRRFGHCHVPAEWAEDINMGRWVVKMRRRQRSGRMSAEMERRLNEVGFVWDALRKRESEQDVLWTKWLTKLQQFHEKHGHWRVPTNQRRFHSLRVWLDNQRISIHNGWLPQERIRRMEEAGVPLVSERIAAARKVAESGE
jgi:hypothetical protein